ncbi:MAG: Rieske 2Fe-2S domain-containing protein [Actinophytocola sp.]|nr:Rieske 2Fe-2S domain-containing protein [Actinophytocola sp.]
MLGTGAVGIVAVTGLAGCGESSEEGGPAPGTVLGSSDEVPVGGGVVFADERVVVTQPVDGEFAGFTAVCTHQGCVVDNVGGGTINCKCHGSKFQIADGQVANGPAEKPLAEQAIEVNDNGDLVVG